nr:ThiF family adenylyltransferase [Chitinophagaceae bacterium]
MQAVLSSSPAGYRPVILDLSKEGDNIYYKTIIEENPQCQLLDYYEHQQKELFKIENPSQPLNGTQLHELYEKFILNKDTATLGKWVYYPWLNKMIHLLDKEAFIALRTSRNQHKITADEQNTLSQKRIGIIGLSVGHAIAVTLAAERTAGVLKLADFDTIDLSNLNRIRTGVQNIGVNKCVVTAREIAELDPYLEVECFTAGITADNIEQFLTEGGKLDLLLDECDSLDVKIMARLAARRHKIPVMMETSDKGMLDVERFDLEPERPLLHG